MASERILELLRRPVDVDEYAEIRELWKTHSIAEDNRDLPGLISTLTDDCVYEVVGTGARWEGHEGAARFYTELLTAFPDIHFDLEYIVIGPQGVCEEARVTATHQARWLEHEPTGRQLEWRNAIFFPWDGAAKKFKGEMVYTDDRSSVLPEDLLTESLDERLLNLRIGGEEMVDDLVARDSRRAVAAEARES